jgi:hypothetical protein
MNDRASTSTAFDDLVTATRRLAEGEPAPGDHNLYGPRRPDAQTKYRQSHRRAITDPLLREALATDDPVRAALCNCLAGLTSVYAEKMIAFYADRKNNQPNDAKDPSLAQLLAIGQQIAKLHDGLTRTKPQPRPWKKKK